MTAMGTFSPFADLIWCGELVTTIRRATTAAIGQFQPLGRVRLVTTIFDLASSSCIRASTVYDWCMARTNIDIDEEACAEVMRRYQLGTKREAVNFALNAVAGEPLSLKEARNLRGSGWDGDLNEMRSSKST